jgi:hypothetical protein
MIGVTDTSSQSRPITTAHDQWLRLAPFLTGLRVSSLPLWRITNGENHFRSQSYIATDGQSVSHSVSLGVELHLGPTTRYLLLCGSYGLVRVGRPLWREDGSVFCICCWYLPAQSFSGRYCLRLHYSGFQASCHSIFWYSLVKSWHICSPQNMLQGNQPCGLSGCGTF